MRHLKLFENMFDNSEEVKKAFKDKIDFKLMSIIDDLTLPLHDEEKYRIEIVAYVRMVDSVIVNKGGFEGVYCYNTDVYYPTLSDYKLKSMIECYQKYGFMYGIHIEEDYLDVRQDLSRQIVDKLSKAYNIQIIRPTGDTTICDFVLFRVLN